MGSVIAEKSVLYKKLLDAYKKKDYLERFNKCYDLVDKSDYKDIHFIISMLKSSENAVGETKVNLIDMFVGCADNVLGNKARVVFLLDILEEARERKREGK